MLEMHCCVQSDLEILPKKMQKTAWRCLHKMAIPRASPASSIEAETAKQNRPVSPHASGPGSSPGKIRLEAPSSVRSLLVEALVDVQ